MATPTPPASRFEIIDIIRGFALFGVLLANMVWTTQYFSVSEEQVRQLSTANVDDFISAIVVALVDYKFYTCSQCCLGWGLLYSSLEGIKLNWTF